MDITCGIADLLTDPCKEREEEKEIVGDGLPSSSEEPQTQRTYAAANSIYTRGGIAPLKEEHDDLVLDLKTRVATSRFDSAYKAFFNPTTKDPTPSGPASHQQTKKPQHPFQSEIVDFSGDVSPSLAATLDRLSRKHVPVDLSAAASRPLLRQHPANKNKTQTVVKDEVSLGGAVPFTEGSSRDGVAHLPDGGTWNGATIDGKMVGNGVYTFPSGAVYDGNFVDSKRNGMGMYRAVDGTTYTGEWFNNCHHGHGTMMFANGDKYTGSWRNDRKEGHGEYVWSNGMSYAGMYSDDVREGQGRMVYSATKFYEGSYVNDKKHGMGTMINDGRKLSGIWENNRFSHDLACAGCKDNRGQCGPSCVLM